HALARKLLGEHDDARAGDLASLLLEQAQLAAGAPLEDPAAFVQRMNRLLAGPRGARRPGARPLPASPRRRGGRSRMKVAARPLSGTRYALLPSACGASRPSRVEGRG